MSAMLEARIAMLERQIATLMGRRGSPFALARSTLAVNDTGPVQTVQAQLDALSVRDGIPVLYGYGFTGSPPVAADLHVAFIDGDRSKAVAIASGHQTYRLRGLATGESAAYDMWGHFIKLGYGGITINGNVTVTGTLSNTGNVVAGTGASGTFSTPTGQTVTVQDGIVTNIY